MTKRQGAGDGRLSESGRGDTFAQAGVPDWIGSGEANIFADSSHGDDDSLTSVFACFFEKIMHSPNIIGAICLCRNLGEAGTEFLDFGQDVGKIFWRFLKIMAGDDDFGTPCFSPNLANFSRII